MTRKEKLMEQAFMLRSELNEWFFESPWALPKELRGRFTSQHRAMAALDTFRSRVRANIEKHRDYQNRRNAKRIKTTRAWRARKKLEAQSAQPSN